MILSTGMTIALLCNSAIAADSPPQPPHTKLMQVLFNNLDADLNRASYYPDEVIEPYALGDHLSMLLSSTLDHDTTISIGGECEWTMVEIEKDVGEKAWHCSLIFTDTLPQSKAVSPTSIWFAVDETATKLYPYTLKRL